MNCLLCVIYGIPPLQMKQPSNIFWLALTAINAKCTHCTRCTRSTRRKCRTRRTRHPTPDVRQLIAMLVEGSHWLPTLIWTPLIMKNKKNSNINIFILYHLQNQQPRRAITFQQWSTESVQVIILFNCLTSSFKTFISI